MADSGVETDAWGIDDRYLDVTGRSHRVSADTRSRVMAAMGVDPAKPAEGPYSDVLVLRGEEWTPSRRGQVELEDGSIRAVEAGRPVRLPLGYHLLLAAGADLPVRLIVSPGRCHLPDEPRLWGWVAQLYATRSRQSWGIGDLADLRRLARWCRQQGAGVVMVNPLTAACPVTPIEPSPYYPSSRRFRNPLYLRVEQVPGAGDLGELAGSGRRLNEQRRIDRDAVFALKMQALESCFARFGGSEAFERYRSEQGEALEQYATYCAIAERHGKDWRVWPEGLRRPGGGAVARYAAEQGQRVLFHAWVQWLLDEQLREASSEVKVIHDLPIGLDVAGADAWCWQEILARDVSVGVPPDEFNPAGQDWGLTPFVPHRLRAAGYQPLIETIRATARHAGGLRIDHVMGLFRLYWIPRGAGPAAGAFVRYRADDLLGIIALESVRAGAFVVGEDLGTVEPGVREMMAQHRMLSYRLFYFETDAPRDYPELALSTVTTHDLPTIAGLWTGADGKRSREAGVQQNEEGLRTLRGKMAALVDEDAAPAEVIERVYAALAKAPSRVLLATLEDALAVEDRPNLPGAGADWPNWSMALPVPLDDFEGLPLPGKIARVLGGR